MRGRLFRMAQQSTTARFTQLFAHRPVLKKVFPTALALGSGIAIGNLPVVQATIEEADRWTTMFRYTQHGGWLKLESVIKAKNYAAFEKVCKYASQNKTYRSAWDYDLGNTIKYGMDAQLFEIAYKYFGKETEAIFKEESKKNHIIRICFDSHNLEMTKYLLNKYPMTSQDRNTLFYEHVFHGHFKNSETDRYLLDLYIKDNADLSRLSSMLASKEHFEMLKRLDVLSRFSADSVAISLLDAVNPYGDSDKPLEHFDELLKTFLQIDELLHTFSQKPISTKTVLSILRRLVSESPDAERYDSEKENTLLKKVIKILNTFKWNPAEVNILDVLDRRHSINPELLTFLATKGVNLHVKNHLGQNIDFQLRESGHYLQCNRARQLPDLTCWRIFQNRNTMEEHHVEKISKDTNGKTPEENAEDHKLSDERNEELARFYKQVL